MKVEDLIVEGKKQVHSDFAKMLLSDLLGINSLQLYDYLNREVSEDIKDKYFEKIGLLKQDKPVQYVIGNVNFYGLTFKVNENVLIPRFETEELVENTIRLIKEKFPEKKNLKIIDLGCGSGAIGLTLKHFLPDAVITLLDISEKALEVAKEKASNLGLDVNFVLGDMLEEVNDKFDVIISNPPYIETNEEIDKIVLDNEPALALFGGDDGLDLYRKILSNCKKNLNDEFIIAFEIGYSQESRIIELAHKNLENITAYGKKDLSRRDRMIFILNISSKKASHFD